MPAAGPHCRHQSVLVVTLDLSGERARGASCAECIKEIVGQFAVSSAIDGTVGPVHLMIQHTYLKLHVNSVDVTFNVMT